MTLHTDYTHDPAARSWVSSAQAEGCDFPLQNLPCGRGEQPTFLQDGDRLILRAHGQRASAARIGVGECSGVVAAAPQ